MKPLKYIHKIFFVLLCSSGLSGCSDTLKTEKELFMWLNDAENGLIKVKRINGMKLTAKYLPPEYLVHKELKAASDPAAANKDSLLNWYKHNYTFLINIAPDEENEKEIDVMKMGVTNYEQYREKFMTMNFDMAQYIHLEVDGQELIPVLTNLENVYGLTRDANIYLVFSPGEQIKKENSAAKLDLVFNDEIFNTGINHFTFSGKDIREMPSINLKNT